MKKWFMALMICLLFIGANHIVYAEQTMVQSTDKNGQTTTYGELVSTMKLNGEEQDLNNMPGVIVDGKVMLPRYLAFKKIMGMKISHTSNTITLKTKEHCRVYNGFYKGTRGWRRSGFSHCTFFCKVCSDK